MHAHQQPPVNLDDLVLQEKQRVLREFSETFTRHKQSGVVRLAEVLNTELTREGQSAAQKKQAIDAAAIRLRAELQKALNASSWFWDLKPSQDAAYQGLRTLAEYWPLNNIDDNGEAEDAITRSPIGCPLFIMRQAPNLVNDAQLTAMLGPETEAYVCAGDHFYYVNKTQLNTIRVSPLRINEGHDPLRLKAILGLDENPEIEGGAQYLKVTDNLRQIQMLYLTRMTDLDTYNRVLLSSGRQRHVDGFIEHLRREPSDPETREMFAGRDREYINLLARRRHERLNGPNVIFNNPPLRDNARSRANQGARAGSTGKGWGFSWGEITTVLGLSIYCIGLVGLCVFTTGAFALASLIVFLVGAALSLTGLALLASEESAVDEANRLNGQRFMNDIFRELNADLWAPRYNLNPVNGNANPQGAQLRGANGNNFGGAANLFPGIRVHVPQDNNNNGQLRFVVRIK